jgi:DUF4097 and DUF4098 domain-containing protein YvlB
MKHHALKISSYPVALSTLAFTVVVSFSAKAITEEHLTKNFTVQPGGKLVVQVDMGSVEVSTNGGNEVAIDVLRKIGRNKKADEGKYLRDHPVEFKQDGDTVTVRCRGGKNNWNFIHRNKNEAKYTITVPAKFNARVDTAGGAIEMSDLTGEVKADTSGGGLKFSRIHGPLAGHTSGGGIHLFDCEGKIGIGTSGGGITSTGGSGSLDAETSGGAIKVSKFQGPANVRTSGGGITLEDVTGQIRGETSGGGIRADLPAPLAGPVKLETSGGGITVRLAASAAFDLDAETSAGDVTSELPITITGKVHHSHLKGQVNGGGHSMILRSSAGGIHLLKSDRQLAEEPK